MNNIDDRLMRRAAVRAEEDPFFLGSALAAYRVLTGWDNAALAAWLGCSTANLARLALCRRPEGDGAMFADEVRQIARYVDADPGRLANLLRAAENVERMREAPSTALMAAQDRAPASESDAAGQTDAPADVRPGNAGSPPSGSGEPEGMP